MSGCEQIESSPPALLSCSPAKANHNIKEKLNLHVKRRLQETTEMCIPSAKRSEKLSSIGKIVKKPKGKHNSSSCSLPEDECSRDATTNSNDGSNIPKEKENSSSSPDILTMVLNDKKLTLLKDPEVMKFLENIAYILSK